MKLKILKARSGDCIILSFGDENTKRYNVLIDGGVKKTYEESLKKELLEVKRKGELIDLLIVTHIDDDHIKGILEFLKDDSFEYSFIKKVIFNGINELGNEINIGEMRAECSYKSGNTFKKEMKKRGILPQEFMFSGEELVIGEMRMKILSPMKEDVDELILKWNKKNDEDRYCKGSISDHSKTVEELMNNQKIKLDESITNKSSVAFIAEFNSKIIMLLGDAHPTVIIRSLRRLGYSKNNKIKCEYVKLSHHGSKKNLTYELLELIECNKYICSTNGSHMNPDKETLSKIIKIQDDVEFYYNYDIFKSIFTSEELLKYKIKNSIVEEINIK